MRRRSFLKGAACAVVSAWLPAKAFFSPFERVEQDDYRNPVGLRGVSADGFEPYAQQYLPVDGEPTRMVRIIDQTSYFWEQMPYDKDDLLQGHKGRQVNALWVLMPNLHISYLGAI